MAIKAPKVQSLSQAMAELNPAYAASNKIVNQQITNLGATEQANIAGLNAAKGQGFNAINNQATGRGGSFSGVPIDEQATYLSTKFLPGVQQAQADTRNNTLALQGQIAANNKEQRISALGTIQQQKGDLNSWNSARAAEQAAAKQAALNRKFQAEESARQRSFTASQAAISRASTAAAAPSASAQIRAMLINGADKDGKVAKSLWGQAAAMAKENGISFGGKNGFASTYWDFAKSGSYKSGYERYM